MAGDLRRPHRVFLRRSLRLSRRLSLRLLLQVSRFFFSCLFSPEVGASSPNCLSLSCALPSCPSSYDLAVDDSRASVCGYGKDCASALRGSFARMLCNPFRSDIAFERPDVQISCSARDDRADTVRGALPHSVTSGARVLVLLLTVDARSPRFADVWFQFETHRVPDGTVFTVGAKCLSWSSHHCWRQTPPLRGILVPVLRVFEEHSAHDFPESVAYLIRPRHVYGGDIPVVMVPASHHS